MTRSGGRPSRLLRGVAGVIVSVAVLAMPAVASAHTEMTGTSPANGAILKAAPSQVEITFGQPVEVATSSIGIKDASGTAVDDGRPFVVRNAANVVGVKVKSDARGPLDVSWRVTATDGHPMTGKFSFTAGESAPTTTAQVTTTAKPTTTTTVAPVATTPETTAVDAVTTDTTAPGLVEVTPATQQVEATNASEVESTPPYIPFFVVALIVGVVAAMAMRRRNSY